MGARQKLNGFFVGGSIIGAACLGWLTQSWLIFILAVIVFVYMEVSAGDIRPSKRGR